VKIILFFIHFYMEITTRILELASDEEDKKKLREQFEPAAGVLTSCPENMQMGGAILNSIKNCTTPEQIRVIAQFADIIAHLRFDPGSSATGSATSKEIAKKALAILEKIK
jgi:hypothetical protein